MVVVEAREAREARVVCVSGGGGTGVCVSGGGVSGGGGGTGVCVSAVVVTVVVVEARGCSCVPRTRFGPW